MNLQPKTYVQFTPSYSSNPDGKNYVEYCWVSLVSFKEWKGNYHSVYGDMDSMDQAIQIKWNDYLREWSASCENGGGQAPDFLQQEIMDARRNVLLSHNSLDGGNEGGDVEIDLLGNDDNGDAFELEYSNLGQESDPFDDDVDDNLEWDDNRDWQLMHHDFNDCLHLDPVAKLHQIAMI